MNIPHIIGAGLAGCEAAWQLATRGIRVRISEMRPERMTPAHATGGLAELVCSNSLRSASLDNAVGLLKEEMRRAGSLVVAAADATAVPAGKALAVDRERFSAQIERLLLETGQVELGREHVERLPEQGPCVIATGPLTSDSLASDLRRVIGADFLYFYDAIAPIIDADTVDMSKVFPASRYGQGGEDDYLNCPLDRDAYNALVDAILAADRVSPRPFEKAKYFGGCMPVDAIAESGRDALRFGPLKPVGLVDPRTGKRPHAVLQLRREDLAATAYNVVGFQTRMTQEGQRAVLALVPGLERARFLRFGSAHRNTYVRGPAALDSRLRLQAAPHVRLAGQITGVEGYVESAASGMTAGILLAGELLGGPAAPPPPTTAIGALLRHVTESRGRFDPSNAHYGLFPPLDFPTLGAARREALAARALQDLADWLLAIART